MHECSLGTKWLEKQILIFNFFKFPFDPRHLFDDVFLHWSQQKNIRKYRFFGFWSNFKWFFPTWRSNFLTEFFYIGIAEAYPKQVKKTKKKSKCLDRSWHLNNLKIQIWKKSVFPGKCLAATYFEKITEIFSTQKYLQHTIQKKSDHCTKSFGQISIFAQVPVVFLHDGCTNGYATL